MNLIDLEPRWVKDTIDIRLGMGLSFWCPGCNEHKLVVFFANPIDGLPPASEQNLWKREGEIFEALTLSPSIHIILKNKKGEDYSHWHGFIRGGQVITI